MKRIVVLAMCAALAVVAQDTNVVVTTQFMDGSPNMWTMGDLQAALQLLNRKYHREVERPDGRRAWHGRLERESIDTNAWIKTEFYEDGASFTFPISPRDPAVSVSNRNARLTTTMTRGVPAGLAAARLRREQEKAVTNIVNVVVEPGVR